MPRALVHIVHADDALRGRLQRLLETRGYSVRGWSDTAAFTGRDLGREPACVLVDIASRRGTDLDLLDAVQRRGPHIGTIVLSAPADAPTVVEALRRGACNFLEVPVDDQLLVDAVRDAFEMLHWRRMIEANRHEAKARIDRLSPREFEVYGGIVNGKQNKMIALELGISPRTVEVYRANIMEKLEQHSVVSLLRIAFLAGYLDDSVPIDQGAEIVPRPLAPAGARFQTRQALLHQQPSLGK